MNYRENFQLWLNDDFFDEETRRELAAITDEKEICILRVNRSLFTDK